MGKLIDEQAAYDVLTDYYHHSTDTQHAALREALSKVPAVSVGGGHEKDHVADHGNMVGDLIGKKYGCKKMPLPEPWKGDTP